MSTAFSLFIVLNPQEKIYPMPRKCHWQKRLWKRFT